MKDFKNHRLEEDYRVWDLDGSEDMRSWSHQTQNWYKTRKGLLVTTLEKGALFSGTWFSTHRNREGFPQWEAGELDVSKLDLVSHLPPDEFEQEEIEAALSFIQS